MILNALNAHYERLIDQGERISPFGYSEEKISFALELDLQGDLVTLLSLLGTSDKKPRPRTLFVPQPPKRSANIAPCFLWDKSSYVLGVTYSTEPKALARTQNTFHAFKALHEQWLADSADEGLQAVLQFLHNWSPAQFATSSILTDEIKDTNLVFRLTGDRCFIHERPAARALRAQQLAQAEGQLGTCLVTGEHTGIATLHPSIKGVNGAQSSGASIVSFNQKAFTSFHKIQGANAPVGQKAAFGYTTALNYLLRRDPGNRQRLQIGDVTVVFWAQARDAEQARDCERCFKNTVQPSAPDGQADTETAPPPSKGQENEKLRSSLVTFQDGLPVKRLDPKLDPNTQVLVLGLAPNASRLSIRFWETARLEVFAERLTQHYCDMVLQPLPWKNPPSIWRLLIETAPNRSGSKAKNADIQPKLSGDLARAILSGQRYPRSLLAQLILRMRSDGHLSSLRIALCKAVLVRDQRLGVKGFDQEIPVSLDVNITHPGYLLGRLFAALEFTQRHAIGEHINITIADRYYGAASATPAIVIPVLLRNVRNHIAKIRKVKTKIILAIIIEKQIDEMIGKIKGEFPKTLTIEAQGLFAIGYYHQRSALYTKQNSDQESQSAPSQTEENK